MKYQKILLKIIEEEIDRFLTEQVAPPAAPTPPADPSAPPPADAPPEGAGEEEGKEDESDVKTALETLAAKTPIEIKKTLLSSLQNGAKRPDTETLVAFVQNKIEEPKEESGSEEEDTETPVPNNVKKAVNHIIKTFKFKVPEKAEKKASEEEKKEDETEAAPPATPAAPGAPAAPTPPAAPPVTESRLQTSLREYLMYKQLSKKVKRR